MLFVQQTEWVYQQNNLKYNFSSLKYFFTKCLELGNILGNGHISELLFMRNIEFKNARTYVIIHVCAFLCVKCIFRNVSVIHDESQNFQKANLVEMPWQNIKDIISHVVLGVTFAFNYLTRIFMYTV